MTIDELKAKLATQDSRILALKGAYDSLKALVLGQTNVDQGVVDAVNKIDADLTAFEADAAPPAAS